MPKQTPLYATHVRLGGKMVDFAGWDMPLHYGSQAEEHHLVRRDAGMFDVSHMGEFEVAGPGPLVQAGSDGRSPAGTSAATELSTRG